METTGLLRADGREALHEHIEQIVVLMLENRSFDHMLGHLTLDGRPDVDGLDRERDFNLHKGKRYGIWHLDRKVLGNWEDPEHSGEAVAKQLARGNQGFVTNFIESRPASYRPMLEAGDRSLVMAYYDGGDLPSYSHLAANFLICDRWFSSVPGATWPNRLYALCGESGGARDNKKLFGKIDWPLYHLRSFVRQLDARDVSWRWYHARSADVEPPTLQIADAKYLWRLGGGSHYALIDRDEPVTGQPSFLEDAANGDLPSVVWIDPDFGITKRGEANDDHPPADISRGQALVAKIANAIMGGPQWERTMLVITYDEHGGFYDHVPPPPAPDDRERMRQYGARVPAFVVSPWVDAAAVCKLTFDHTSIIRTVLERFCNDGDTIPWMGARTNNANHLGQVLEASSPRAATPIEVDVPEDVTPESLDVPDLAEHERWAAPRPAAIDAEQMFAAGAELPVMNDLQLGLIRAGLERRDGS